MANSCDANIIHVFKDTGMLKFFAKVQIIYQMCKKK